MRRLAILAVLALAACAQPFEGRVAARLAEAGLPRPMAECMAERWVDRLSLVQLDKLSDLAESVRGEGGRLTLSGFLDRVVALDDREIVGVVTTSSVVCALRQ
jgi:hypothetical protein